MPRRILANSIGLASGFAATANSGLAQKSSEVALMQRSIKSNVALPAPFQNGSAATPADLAAAQDPPGCFAAGILVHTKEGLKPIEEIRVGDWVMSQPENSDMLRRRRRTKEEYTYRRVTQTFVHEDNPILDVTYVQPGADNVKAPLRVTPNHPIWSKGHGWIAAEQLKVGHTLAIGYFGNVIVTKVRPANDRVRVYNIEVDEFQTYFVAPLGVWVHNKSTQRPRL